MFHPIKIKVAIINIVILTMDHMMTRVTHSDKSTETHSTLQFLSALWSFTASFGSLFTVFGSFSPLSSALFQKTKLATS